jgi:ribose transport system permease protein
MSGMGKRNSALLARNVFVLLLLVVAVAANIALQPGFLAPRTLNGNLRIFLPLILVTVGQTIVILGGGIDISAGAIVSVVNVLLATRVGADGDGGTMALMVALALVVGMALGAVNGFFVAILRLQPIITTYATSFLFGGLALWILPTPGGGVTPSWTAFYRDTTLLFVPLAVPVIALLLLGWYALQQVRYGRYLYAVGGKADAAFQSGVPVRAVQWSTYVLSGLLAACGGVALTLLTGAGNGQSGDALTLQAITAVVIGGTALSGGTGGIGGPIIGAIVLGLFRNIISFANVPTWLQTFVNAAIIVVALAMPGLIALFRRKRV